MAWAPDPADQVAIDDFFGPRLPNAVLWLLPRRMARQVVRRDLGPHAFRAVTRGSNSYVFVDDTETRDSTAFLMAHELTHQLVSKNRVLTAAFHDARAHDSDGASDHFHEVDPEERFCDGIAANLLGRRLDRSWWRPRVNGQER